MELSLHTLQSEGGGGGGGSSATPPDSVPLWLLSALECQLEPSIMQLQQQLALLLRVPFKRHGYRRCA